LPLFFFPFLLPFSSFGGDSASYSDRWQGKSRVKLRDFYNFKDYLYETEAYKAAKWLQDQDNCGYEPFWHEVEYLDSFEGEVTDISTALP
jgi:hypothetical protein